MVLVIVIAAFLAGWMFADAPIIFNKRVYVLMAYNAFTGFIFGVSAYVICVKYFLMVV